MSDYSIRLARAGDAAYLPAIERAAAKLFADDPAADQVDFNDVWTEDGHRKLIAKGHCLVAEIGETIVGFLASQPFGRELHIWEMDVHPDAQGQGFGKQLMHYCIEQTGNATLQLDAVDHYPALLSFYHSLGFEIIETGIGLGDKRHLFCLSR